MKSLYCVFLCALCSTLIGFSEANAASVCEILESKSEEKVIKSGNNNLKFCCFIPVATDKYMQLNIFYSGYTSDNCYWSYVETTAEAIPENFKFCASNFSSPRPITFFSDTKIEISLLPNRAFTVIYTIRSIVCAHKDHFSCSESDCVYQYQVCDGKKDCDNGKDEDNCGAGAIKGAHLALANETASLRRRRSSPFGWGENTHRAIVALHLSENAHFENKSMEEELMAQELELKLLAAIHRNSTEELSVADLSLYVDALMVTCQNPLQFYGHDLIQNLKDRLFKSRSPVSGAILTLCNANNTIPENVVLILLDLLQKESDYPFIKDIQATTVMALNCIKRKTSNYNFEKQWSEIVNSTNEKFIAGQNSDGSFGTAYSTALITQALLSSNQENNPKWNLSATVRYLMHQLQQSPDIVGSYLVLPILKDKTLFDISNSHCVRSRKTRDDAVTDIASKPGQKVNIQFSLYIGDQKDVIHTIHLRLPETSTAFDVMRLAESNDSKFKFSSRYADDHLYVYRIANIFNDPQVLKFWLLYATSGSNTDEPLQFTTSPDKFSVKNGMHLIMWYRRLPTQKNEILLIDGSTESPRVETGELPESDLNVKTEDVQTDAGTEKNLPSVFSKDQLHILSGLGLKDVK